MMDNTSKIQDDRWYKDNVVNFLLQHYFANHSDVEILTAMLGTDWQGVEGTNNTLAANLHSFHEQRVIALSDPFKNVKDKVLVPINLNENHWALLYILYNEKDARPATVYYFDPFGSAINENVKQAVNTVYPNVEIVNINARVQNDGYNCGPWIIEAARSFVNAGAEPNCDINRAREEHEKIIRAQSLAREAQSMVSSTNQRKLGVTIDADAIITAKRNRIASQTPPTSPVAYSPRTQELIKKLLTQEAALDNVDVDKDAKEIDELLVEQYSQLKATFGINKVDDLLTQQLCNEAQKDVVKLVISKFEKDEQIDSKDEQQKDASKPLTQEEADRRFAMALQNAEVSNFLSRLSQTRFQPKPYLPAKPAVSCAVEALKQQDTSEGESVETRTNFGIA